MLVRDPFAAPETYTIGVSEYDNPDPGFLETTAAALRREGLIGSALSSPRASMSNEAFNRIEPDYDPYDDIKGYEQYADRFTDAYNPQATAAIKAGIDQEQKDLKTLEAAGWTGYALSMGAAIADPTILLPGGAFARAGKLGYSAGRTALNVGKATGVAVAIQEAGLQATQETRTGAESAMNIGGSVILGGLVGAAGAKLLSNAEWTRFGKALEEELSGEVPNPYEVTETFVNRARAAGLSSDSLDQVKLDDLGVGGSKMAEVVAKATAAARINPGIQTMLSPSVKVRQIYNRMVDNTIYTKQNMEGETLGSDIENLVKRWHRGATGEWITQSKDLYRQARKAGFNGSRHDFYVAVGKAARRGDVDTDGNEFVSKAAKLARDKIFNPLLERAQDAGLLPEGIERKVAESYLTRVWNRQMLIAKEPEFMEIAENYIRGRLESMTPEDLATIKQKADDAAEATRAPFKTEQAEDEIMLELWKSTKEPKFFKKPILHTIRKLGGVDPDSAAAGNLRALGVDNKTFPGIFKRGGRGSLDNLVASEFDEMLDNFQLRDDGYIEENDLMEAVRRELSGDSVLAREQQEMLAEYEEAMKIIDEWLERRGYSGEFNIRDVEAELRARFDDIPRTLEELEYEVAQMRNSIKAQARKKSKVPDFVSQEDIDDYIKKTARAIFNNLTGRGDGDVPEWMVPAKHGPMKELTFGIRDELVEEFLESDMEAVLRRYTRVVPAEIELKSKFGSADMKEAFAEIREDYALLRENAKTEKELEKLTKAEKRDIKNLEAFRDMLRGTYRAAEENSDWGAITRAALAWNYMRLLGGVVLSSVSDLSRTIAVHGVRATMKEALPALVSGLRAAKIARKEVRELGAVTESVLLSRIATMMELNDPYRMGTGMDRFISNTTNLFSRATGLAWWNDTMKTISSVMTQNRLAKTVQNWDGASKSEKAFAAMLGIDENMAQFVSREIQQHGIKEGGVWGVNWSKWGDEGAKDAWAAAINKATDVSIVTKGIADQPLWARSNAGRIIMQFKSFGMASHQRVLIAGLQNNQHRLAEMAVFATTLGMMASWLKFVERGDMEQAERLLDNPGLWIANGLDRTGILSIPFEISNTFEKLGGPGFVAGAQALAGDKDRGGTVSRYASRNPLGAVLGPSAGIFGDWITIANQLGSGDIKESGVNAAIRQMPGATLPGVRSGLHYWVKPELHDSVE